MRLVGLVRDGDVMLEVVIVVFEGNKSLARRTSVMSLEASSRLRDMVGSTWLSRIDAIRRCLCSRMRCWKGVLEVLRDVPVCCGVTAIDSS